MTVLNHETAGGFPEYLAVAAVPEGFRDENGHMNVRHHFDLAASAIRGFMDWAGIGSEYAGERHCGFFTVEQHIRFESEVEIGDMVRATVAVIGRGPKTVHGIAILLNDTTRAVATTVEFVAVHVDLQSRSAVPFPDAIGMRIDGARVSDHGVLSGLPLCGVMGVSRRSDEQVRTAE